MEPRSVTGGPERGPSQPPVTEKIAPGSPEAIQAPNPAAQEVASESSESMNQNQGMVLPPLVQHDPVIVQQPIQPPAQAPVQDEDQTSSPAAAQDSDVIEKEWVNRAKSIIGQTRDDPYTQEKEVSKLQADYLKKRYGKVIKTNKE